MGPTWSGVLARRHFTSCGRTTHLHSTTLAAAELQSRTPSEALIKKGRHGFDELGEVRVAPCRSGSLTRYY